MKTLHIFSNLQSLLHLIPIEYSGGMHRCYLLTLSY